MNILSNLGRLLNLKLLNILIIISIISKSMGFLRDLILTYFWGATGISDAFILSMVIPGTLCDLLVQAIAVGYIPIYVKTKIEKGADAAWEFTNTFLELLLLCSLPICMIGVGCPQFIIKLFASGFNQNTTEVAALFIQITIFSILCKMLVSVLSGFLQSNNRFIIPALMGIPYDVVIIGGIILSKHITISVMPISIVLAGIIQAIIIIRAANKLGVSFKIKHSILTEETKAVIKLLIPLILIVGTNQLNIIVDRSFASYIQSGAVTILDYSNKICLMIENVLVFSIVAILYPKLSETVAKNDQSGFANNLLVSSNQVIFYLLPMSVLLIFTSQNIVSFLFGRGQFSPQNVTDTALCMSGYGVGVCFVALRTIYTRALYSLGRIKYVTNVSIGILLINVLFNYLFSKLFGLWGLALSTSLCMTLNTVFLAVGIKQRNPSFKILDKSVFLKALFAAGIMFIIIAVSMRVTFWLGLEGKTNDFVILSLVGSCYLAIASYANKKIKGVHP